MTFPDLIPTWDYRENELSEFDLDLSLEHASDCECSLCTHEPEGE